jgi:hypothetical protein
MVIAVIWVVVLVIGVLTLVGVLHESKGGDVISPLNVFG